MAGAARPFRRAPVHQLLGTTADAFKRIGVPSQLVEAAEEWGRSQGATVAICDTFIDSPLSMPFRENRMGYTRRAVIFRKPLR
jgi:hypothetical protein